jgi:pyruvate dehydrogenase E2 component (dihydrolipoamide acetyltransferase)
VAEAGVKKAAAEVFPGSEPAGEIKITPRALKLAEDTGVDYSKISGIGIAGAITRNDIKQYLSEQGDAANKSSMSSVRKTIYRRMMASLSKTAQTTMTMDVEVSALVKAYGENKPLFRKDGIKLSYTGIIIKATAGALKSHPLLRTTISEEKLLRTSPEINIGIAVDIEGGLTVPVLKKAGQKDLRTICREVEDLSGRAKERSLSVDDLSGGTMTITNLGMFDIKYFTPILNFPESAILGVGAIVEEPVVKEGNLRVGNVMALSLTHDHRLIDGAPAARFLRELKGLLMDPKELF